MARLCVENQICFFGCDFRLAPEYEYPTHFKDGVAGIDWVYDNCE